MQKGTHLIPNKKSEYWEWKGYERQRDKPLNKQTIAKPWPQEGHSHEEERN